MGTAPFRFAETSTAPNGRFICSKVTDICYANGRTTHSLKIFEDFVFGCAKRLSINKIYHS